MTRRPVLLALIGTAAIAAVTVAITSGSSPYSIKVEFTDADGLRTDFAVREQGVVVGRVAGVTVTRSDTALATLELDPAAAPVGQGATASIHPSNLLGEKFVQIDAGDARRPLPSGSLIPRSSTSTAAELDQVLNVFDADTRRATAAFLAEQGNSLVGRGQDLASLLKRLPASLDSGRRLIGGLAADNAALGRLVDESDRILSVTAPQRAALGAMVTSARGALGTLAQREQSLGATIEAAPGALTQLRSTLDHLQAAAAPLGPASVGMRSMAGPLTNVLHAVPTFTKAAVPALQATGRVAPVLQRLGDQGTPPLRALGPVATRLGQFADALSPVATVFSGHIGQILAVLQGWARAIADRDGIGHIYRIEILAPLETLFSLINQTPPTTQQRPRHRATAHRAPRPSAKAPAVPQTGAAPARKPARPLDHVTSTVNTLTHKVTGAVTQAAGSVPVPSPPTGSSNLKPLLNYLLGR